MAEVRETDLVVVGGGPGGYAAAFHAADLGIRTILVDVREKPGGECLFVGCIPSKALLHAAEVLESARHASDFGIHFSKPRLELEALREWKNWVVEKLAGGLPQLAARRGVDFIRGRARFRDGNTLELEDSETGRIRFKQAILATGSRPARLPGLDEAGDLVLDSAAALDLAEIPKTLLVVGGGYIGLELGTVYAALGSRVTIVEMLDGLLPGVDRDLVKPLDQRIRAAVDQVHLKTKVSQVKKSKKGLDVSFEGEFQGQQTFHRVLVAVGRRPNSHDLGLENTDVQVDEKGFVQVDEQRRTTQENILAIGDVAGEPQLAHKASREGKVAAEVVAGKKSAYDPQAVPAVVFTNPEIAWTGLTETEAQRQGIRVEVARFPWAASGRALTLGRTEGLTKILFEPDSGRVLGVGIVGPQAGELIAEGTLAVEMAAVAEDLALTIHAHPTLSETLMEAAEVFLGEAIHIYKK